MANERNGFFWGLKIAFSGSKLDKVEVLEAR